MKKSNKGITLIALIISIIVLLILAGVAFSTLAGENGVINKAQKAVSKNKQAVALEEVSLAWTEFMADWHETWSAQGVSFASQVSKENLQEYLGDTTKQDYTGTVNEVTNNGDRTYSIKYTPKDSNVTYLFRAGEDGKVVLSNGLTVTPAVVPLDFFTNKNTQPEATLTAELQSIGGPVSWTISAGSDVVSLSSTSGTTVKVTPLKAGTATIKASAENGDYEDTCSITVTEKTAVISIGTLSETSITVDKDSTATVTTPNLNPSNATESLDWTTSDSTIATVDKSSDTKSATISGRAVGGPVTITVTAANGDSSTVSVTVVQPVTVTFKNGTETYTTKNTIAGSSLTATNWPTEPEPEDSSHEFVGWFDAQTGGTQYAYDTIINADTTLYARWATPSIKPTATSNTSSLTIANTRGEIEVIWLDGKTNSKANVANTPNIPSGSEMTPVTWSLNNTTHKWDKVLWSWNGTQNKWQPTTTSQTEWYNYNTTDKQWANVIDPAGSYFVWIPRFAYRITYYDANNTVVGYYDGYGLWKADGTQKRTFSDIVSTIEYDGKKYIVHNAFLSNANNGGGFTTSNPAAGEDGIDGFWVAKYEMSNNSGNPVSVPEVDSWRNICIGDCYTTSLNYNTTLKSHLMKNSEWGAVAYLAHSQYGLNGEEIRINNYYNSGTYRTGQAAKTADASGTTDTYTYNQADNNGNPQGPLASTTKNIYGIYDLSGGAFEYVAAYNINYTAGSTDYFGASYGKNMVDNAKSGSTYISTKYITAYNGTSNYQGTDIYTVGITGDATKEVYTNTQVSSFYRNWFTDYSIFAYSSYPFFLRGGDCSSGASAGLFSSHNSSGDAYSNVSFRVVLAPGAL